MVAVNKKGNVCLVQKSRYGTVHPSSLSEMILVYLLLSLLFVLWSVADALQQAAKKLGVALISKLDGQLQAPPSTSAASKTPKRGFLE